ncbi:MAG: hypothetical protein FWD36_06825 [Treponema sp.]|nr:hypothetical protein [Treponema sp.]
MDETIAEIQPGGNKCLIFPRAPGQTELIVEDAQFRRNILIVVCASEYELENVYAMNLDNRHYKIRKNETIIINPYYAVKKPYARAICNPVYNNNVIDLAAADGKSEIRGKNEGIEQLIIRNSQCINEIRITIEVSDEAAGNVISNTNLVYMSTKNNVMILEPNEQNIPVNIAVIGEYQGDESHFIWNKDNNNITITAFGTYALLNARAARGETTITVTNAYCQNILTIKIIVGEKHTFENTIEPYIFTEKSVYSIDITDSGIVIDYEIRNLPSADYSKVECKWFGTAVNCRVSGRKIVINPVMQGSSEISIEHPDVMYNGKIYVVVNGSKGNSAVYLTTAMNYVITGKSMTKMVEVNLVNYNELNSDNITWKSENSNIAYVIGTGPIVQVYGIAEGITNITASHVKAFDDLKIVVKVVSDGKAEEVCYLTTSDNVIETYVSANSNSIYISKVGGISEHLQTTWTVDNPSILGIMGNGNVGYYTAKTPGIARITISDIEAGSLDIVVIVRKAKPGTEYITTENSIIQIRPGSANNAITVELAGGEERDNSDFAWQIYSQEPGNTEVARNGGNVIALFATNNRASVGGLYAGKAKIRVTHPKANNPLYILVQVTDYMAIEFEEKSKDLLPGATEFVMLRTPNYENVTGKIIFETDNPAVCTVVGTNYMALLSGNGVGQAVITARIANTEASAKILVNVAEEAYSERIKIITALTSVSMNPRAAPIKLKASLIGDGVSGDDSRNIQWQIDPRQNNMIIMYPSAGYGDEIQIEPVRRAYDNPEGTTITVSHPMTRDKKVIYVQVAELTNAFTLNKYQIRMESGQMETLSCNIIGGNQRDYSEVVWSSGYDINDPAKEVVKIMGGGKTVQLYAVNDGITEVTVFYRGMTCVAYVEVRSSNYFEITMKSMKLYPGQLTSKGEPITVEYLVRPNDTFITWYTSEADPADPVCRYNIIASSNMIALTPMKEGQVTISGVAAGRRSSINIMVAYNYSFVMNGYVFESEPKKPAVEYIYTITPPNTNIKLKDADKAIAAGFEIEILPPVSFDNTIGKGIVRIKSNKETNYEQNIIQGGYHLEFEQYEADGKTRTGKNWTIDAYSRFPANRNILVPVFSRGSGIWSNRNHKRSYTGTGDGRQPKGNGVPGGEFIKHEGFFTTGENRTDNYSLIIGDGEDHYILLDQVDPESHITDISINTNIDNTSNGRDDGRGITYETIELNGAKAIRINGGKDYIVYSHFGSEYELQIKLSTDRPNTGPGYVDEFTIAPVINPADMISLRNLVEYSTSRTNIHYTNELWPDNCINMSIDNNKMYNWDLRPQNNTNRTTFPDNTEIGQVYYLARGKRIKLTNGTYHSLTQPMIGLQPIYEVQQVYDWGIATDTIWNPVSNDFTEGNITIRTGITLGSSAGGNSVNEVGYFYYYFLANGKRFKPYSSYPGFNTDGTNNVGAFHYQKGAALRNVITNKYQVWNKGVDPLKNEPDSESNMNGILYTRDWNSSFLGFANATDYTVYLRYENLGYRRRTNGYFVQNIDVLYKSPMGMTITFANGQYIRMTMLDIKKEKMGNEYIYFPMASKNTSIITEHTGDSITISYKTSRGENTINIAVKHEIRQSHARYDPAEGEVYYRKAESWDKVKLVPLPYIYDEPDNSGDYNGLYLIDLDY